MKITGILIALGLSGCAAGAQLGAPAAQLGTQAISDPSGTAANLFGIPAATIAKQMVAELAEIQMVAAQLQLLKAQLDGTLPVVQVPPIVRPVVSTPVTATPPPSGPTVTPNVAQPRSRVSYRRRPSFFEQHPPTFRLTADLNAEPISRTDYLLVRP